MLGGKSEKLCWDCKEVYHNVNVTGSFLCEPCQDRQFARLRQIVKGDSIVAKLNMTVREFVQMKHENKMSIVAIAKQKGVTDPSVHNWIKKNKAEIDSYLEDRKKNVLPSASAHTDTTDYKKLYNSSLELLKKRESEITRLNNLTQESSFVIAELKEKNSKLQEKLAELQTQTVPTNDVDEYKEKYEKEKAAHQKLFAYLEVVLSAN